MSIGKNSNLLSPIRGHGKNWFRNSQVKLVEVGQL